MAGFLTRFAQLLGLVRRPTGPRPPGWNKTLDDLRAENRNLYADELEWGRQYQLEQLRAHGVFPRDGDVYENRADIEVAFATHWRAPYGRGVRAVLPAGTRLRAVVPPGQTEPLAVQLVPLEEAALEARVIPEADRQQPDYAGFSLTLGTEQINRDFRRLSIEEPSP